MKWLYLSASTMALATALLFSGCGEDADAICAFQVEQDLDNGNYSAVITALENNGTCNGALSNDDAWMNLGAAYMGTAGMSMTNLLGTVLDTSGADPMTSFMSSFASAASSSGLNALNDANKVYGYIATAHGVACTDANLAGPAATACFYDGLVTMTKAVGTLTAVLGDAITFLTTTVVTGSSDDVNDNGTADGIDVASCAIAGATTVTAAGTPCPDTTITYTDNGTVSFTDPTYGVVGTFVKRTFTVSDVNNNNGGPALIDKLIDQVAAVNSPVTTSGSCSNTFTSSGCTIDMSTCYPCPVIIDGASSTTTSGLLDIVNGGSLDSILAILPADSGIDANMTATLQTSIYTTCLAGGGVDTVDCIDDNITTETELAFFLQNL